MGALKVNLVQEKGIGKQVRKRVVHNADKNSAQSMFREAQQLASLVTANAASVKAFLGRWKAIENRLLQLRALLTEMSHLRCLSDNAACKELLKVMIYLEFEFLRQCAFLPTKACVTDSFLDR